MIALSEYFRLIMYPLLTTLCLMATMYFPNTRTVFVALAFFFALFGAALLVLALGNVELNTWMRALLVPVAQVAVAASLLRSFWRRAKKPIV